MTPPIEPGRSTSLEHLPVLDGLRGVAVAIVVAYHAHWLTGGYLGVDVFFVLSGFLITRLLLAEHERTGRIDLRHFWSRRARRLVPALVLVVVVAAIGERLRGRVDGPAGGRIDVIGALTYSTNWLRLRSGAGYWSAFGGPSLLDHTWSLAIEEQFYVLWPLVVVGIVRFVRRPGARVVVLATSTALAGAWSIVVFSRSFDASRVYMGTDTRAVALVAGATVAALVAWHGPLRSLVVKGLGFASAAVLVDMFVNLSGTEVRTYRGGLLMCSLATALVIAATATACPPLLARPLALPALRYLGERSYGIYLWHWPIMVALGVAKAPLSPSWRRLSAIAITLIVAEISYRVVERPIRRHGLAAFGPRWRPLLGGGVATTVALGAIALPVPVRPAASGIVLTTVYFAPEAHAAYVALGFGGSPGRLSGDGWAVDHWGEVALPDGIAYFASRGAILGQVRGEVVAAAFGVFNPVVVVAAVARGWEIADADSVVEARTRGAVAQLERILGVAPAGIERVVELLERAVAPLTVAGHPMFAGLLGLTMPAGIVGRMWRLGDELREFRGDAHIAAAVAAGLDGCQLQVLTERYAGMPARSYAAGRGWDEGQLGSAEADLQARGLLEGEAVTSAGREVREAVESATDEACASMTDALGVDLIELVARLQSWGAAVREAHGYYPSSPQEAVLSPAVNAWMSRNGLRPFGATDAAG